MQRLTDAGGEKREQRNENKGEMEKGGRPGREVRNERKWKDALQELDLMTFCSFLNS